MNEYLILANPGHNRVYFEASKEMSKAELNMVLKNIIEDEYTIGERTLEGIFYVSFKCKQELNEEELYKINKLSFRYAIYKVVVINDVEYLQPILNNTSNYIDEGMSSILKYTGKTNELFTRMMINIAVNNSDNQDGNIKVLDPIAGKGTTLYEALINGYDAYGIEIGEKVSQEAFSFIKRYLEKAKLKHSTRKERLSGENKKFRAQKYTVNISKTKEDLKNKNFKHWELVSGNSMYCDNFFKKNFFDVIVGDLPYGVQHGNVTEEKKSGITRNPSELLKSCVGSWRKVLKKDGCLVLAWNNLVLSREDFTKILEDNGFVVLNSEEYLKFEHRVDQAIKRDIIVAKKK